MKKEEIFKKLAEPFTVIAPDGKTYPAHKWREQQKGMCIPYIDSRQVSQRLNDVVGVDGWKDTLIETAGNYMICELTLTIDGNDISRSDVGTPSKFEKEKGQASDAFKRAAVKFGIGAYLYSMEPVRLKTVSKNGKTYPATDKGEPLYDVSQLSSYINQKHPLRAKFTEIYQSLDKVKQDSLQTQFSEIWEALQTN